MRILAVQPVLWPLDSFKVFLNRLELRLAEQRVGQGAEADVAAKAVRQRSVFRIEGRRLEEFAEIGGIEGAFLVYDVVFVQ